MIDIVVFYSSPLIFYTIGSVLLYAALRILSPGPKLGIFSALTYLAMFIGSGLVAILLVLLYTRKFSEVRPLIFFVLFVSLVSLFGWAIGWAIVRRRTKRASLAVLVPVAGVSLAGCVISAPLIIKAEAVHAYYQPVKEISKTGKEIIRELNVQKRTTTNLPLSLVELLGNRHPTDSMLLSDRYEYLPQHLSRYSIDAPYRYDEMEANFPIIWLKTTNDWHIPTMLYNGNTEVFTRVILDQYLEAARTTIRATRKRRQSLHSHDPLESFTNCEQSARPYGSPAAGSPSGQP